MTDQHYGYKGGFDAYNPTNGRIASICRQFIRPDKPGEKSPFYAKELIHRLLMDPSIDLFGVFPPPETFSNTEDAFYLVYNLLCAKSMFFEIILEADESLCGELWSSICQQADHSTIDPNVAVSSVLMRLISEWTVCLLPVEMDPNVSVEQERTMSTPYRIRTPLELFRSDSPLLSRMEIYSSSSNQMFSRFNTNSLRPKHINMISQFVYSLGSTNQFPSVHRTIILRYLCKQFHIFCLVNVADAELKATKAAIHAQPPFSTALYQFLYKNIDMCPSVKPLKDLIDIWLCFVRPWRYEDPTSSSAAVERSILPYVQFIHNHHKFYDILLGKILRRLCDFDLGAEHQRILKSVVEFCWKKPNVDVFSILDVDPRPPTLRLVDHLKMIRQKKQQEILIHTDKLANTSFWDSIFGSNDDSAALRIDKEAVSCFTDIINEAEAHLCNGEMSPTTSTAPAPVPPLLYTTPKSRKCRMPDHLMDQCTGIQHLTPNGRQQVRNRLGRFDSSMCYNLVPPIASGSGYSEWRWLSAQLTELSLWISERGPIRALGECYNADNWIGMLSRVLLDAPFPDPMHRTAPFFRDELPCIPPVLNLRFLSRYLSIGLIFILWISFYFSPLCLLLIPVIYVLILMYAVAEESSM